MKPKSPQLKYANNLAQYESVLGMLNAEPTQTCFSGTFWLEGARWKALACAKHFLPIVQRNVQIMAIRKIESVCGYCAIEQKGEIKPEKANERG